MLTRRRVFAFAPSNIALIKYMGKEDSSINLPSNGSLSLTLDALRTEVEIREVGSSRSQGDTTPVFRWIPELPQGSVASLDPDSASDVGKPSVPTLSAAGQVRYLTHAERCLSIARNEMLPEFGLQVCAESGDERWEIRTSNTFPSDSGIASSASSFAALTLAVVATQAQDPGAFQRLLLDRTGLARALSSLSRQGSGSSCRSFEGPWVEWEAEYAEAVPARMLELTDLVLIVTEAPKTVPSSRAHAWVQGSPLWTGRTQRVKERLAGLGAALAVGDLREASRIAWQEMWEMHSLFHTCPEPFTYWEPATVSILKWLSARIHDAVPPIVTLDAGPNVHVLVPTEAASRWRREIEAAFPGIRILRDRQGQGALLLEWGSSPG